MGIFRGGGGFFPDSSWINPGFSKILVRFLLDSSWILAGFLADSCWIFSGFFLDSFLILS